MSRPKDDPPPPERWVPIHRDCPGHLKEGARYEHIACRPRHENRHRLESLGVQSPLVGDAMPMAVSRGRRKERTKCSGRWDLPWR
jgi:hypothetical protein